jgi:hypothetical protein
MVNKNKKIACTVILATALLSTKASAFVLLSSSKATLPVTPANPTINFIWDGSTPQIDEKNKYAGGQFETLDDKAFMQQLLQDALNVWNTVPGSFLRMTVEEGATQMDEKDKVFSLVVEKSDNLSSAAYAKPTIDDEDLEAIVDCDINISDTKTTAKDLAYTITHELGHCVGLGHPHTNYGAMMGYSRGSRLLKLGADDIAGVVYLYPDPTYVSSDSKEIVCSTVSGAKSSKLNFGILLLLLAPLLTLLADFLKGLRPQLVPVRAPKPKNRK